MKKLLVPLFILGLIGFVPHVPSQVNVMPAVQANTAEETLRLDVACDCRTFRLNRVNPAATDMGSGGDTFIVSGKLYRGGTIPPGGTFDNPSPFGPDSPGSIGNWVCRGTVNSSEADIKAGAALLFTLTQYFLLDDGKGLITESVFLANGTERRAITGGMGSLSGATGDSRAAEEIGTNRTGCPNIRFAFTLK